MTAATAARHSQIGSSVSKCFQRQIREQQSEKFPRATIEDLSEAAVIEISSSDAKPIILQYEWLGTMGRSVHCCGLVIGEELIGVACFGWPSGVQSRDICGRENRHLAICLERGACVHYAPKNAGSYLVRHSCRLISERYGYKIFYAYSDEDAGEIGTIYQACNWTYIGQGVGRSPGRLREYYRTPEGKIVSSRSLRHRKMKKRDAVALGWEVLYQKPKHKYIWIEGDRRERRRLMDSMRYPSKPYPKRDDIVSSETTQGGSQ